jgi:putative transposase
MKTLWACDFFTQRVLTLGGFVDYYLLLFVHLETRRLFISPATRHPTDEWVTQQARNLHIYAEEQGLKVTYVIRDNDRKFSGGGLDALLKSGGAESVPIVPLSPNMNDYASWCTSLVRSVVTWLTCGLSASLQPCCLQGALVPTGS